MKKKLALLSLTAALVALTAAPAAAKPAWTNKSADSIVETVVNVSGAPFTYDTDGSDFDILRDALVVTGLINAFDGTDYTVFAPNDAAFKALLGMDADAPESIDTVLAVAAAAGAFGGVENVLLYHVAEGVRVSPSVINAKAVEMLNGGKVTVGQLDVNTLDIRVSDGIIHIIDNVLLP